MTRLRLFGIIIFLSLFICSCTNESFTSKRTGAYLGETPPDSIAKLFAPGFITTGLYTRDIAISPDGNEIYFCVNIGSSTFMTMLFTQRINNIWTEPQIPNFARDLTYFTVEPHFSADGQQLFFASNRENDRDEKQNSDIWFIQRTDSGWAKPVNAGPLVNTNAPEFFPSVTNDGTLYFTRDDLNTGVSYIYRSKLINGAYAGPELLPEEVNAGRSRFNACIDPAESFIIIPIYGMPDSFGATDYYISFRSADDKWSQPVNLGRSVNSKSRYEYSASLSPDGKYLFFMTSRVDTALVTHHDIVTMDDLKELALKPGNGNPDIFWIDASFIDKLKPDHF
ncbi:MAG: hypothetical protein P8X42_14115 [Calditrichaceae bacterium]